MRLPVYIINRPVAIKNLCNISHCNYFMGYAATTVVILYWNPDQPFLFKKLIMLGLINIIFVCPWKTITLQVLYCFNKILKLFFIICTCSTWSHVNLILHPLHFVVQKFSHMKLSYLILERKLILIYWMMKILKSLMSLIQSQNH